MIPNSSAITNGDDSDASQINNLRTDALTRFLKFEIVGSVTAADGQGGSFIMPFDGDVISINSILTSGTATIRLKNGGTTIKSGVSVTSTYAEESTITTPAFTAGDLITLDTTAVLNAVHLTVIVEVLAS